MVYMVECNLSMWFLTSVQFCIFNGLLYVENEVETILHACGSAKGTADLEINVVCLFMLWHNELCNIKCSVGEADLVPQNILGIWPLLK